MGGCCLQGWVADAAQGINCFQNDSCLRMLHKGQKPVGRGLSKAKTISFIKIGPSEDSFSGFAVA
jgi:hypothetical protein